MIKIGFDVDGVLRDNMAKVTEVFKLYYPHSVIGEVAYNYDFPHIQMSLKDKFNIIFNEFPKEIFLDALPYQGVCEDFLNLLSWADENNFKFACATTQEKHLITLTYSWLAKYNFSFEELYITNKKGEIGLDYLIDDAPYNYENWIKNGNPEENFFLMHRDWNHDVPATNRIRRISEIKNLIKINH